MELTIFVMLARMIRSAVLETFDDKKQRKLVM